jgi:phage terminase large subunit
MHSNPNTSQVEPEINLEDILEDHEAFIKHGLGSDLWEKQLEIVRAVQKYDDVAVRSCHAIGKSFTSARIALAFLYAWPESIVWTTAPTARQVYNILWREIRGAHEASITPLGGTLLKTRLELLPQWYAFGFATDVGEQFQGLHAKSGRILGIADEASGIAQSIMEASEGTLTSQHAKRLMLGNPNKRTGYFADSFKNPKVHKIKISAYDTPNFKANGIKNASDLLKFDQEKGIENAVIVAPHLITPKFALSILLRYGRTSTNFLVRVEAEFPTADADTLISLDLIEAAMVREVEVHETDQEIIGCDPARFGDDRTAIIVRIGKKVVEKIVVTKHDNGEVAGRLIALKRKYKGAKIIVESNGLGGGVIDFLTHHVKDTKEFPKSDIVEVNVSEKAIEDEKYQNVRAELWDTMADWLKEGSIPENDEDFREGADVKYKFTSKGKIQIEDKDDIKKRIGKSPDVLDALAVTFSAKYKKASVRVRVIG